jgi:hypothetical protein
MDFSTFQAELRRIGGSVQAFAAIAAALRLHQAKKQADPAVQARLLAAVDAVLPGGLAGLDAQQVSDALVYVTLQIEDAEDLFRNPDRPPGWVFRDPTILQAQGQGSRHNVRCIGAGTPYPRLRRCGDLRYSANDFRHRPPTLVEEHRYGGKALRCGAGRRRLCPRICAQREEPAR